MSERALFNQMCDALDESKITTLMANFLTHLKQEKYFEYLELQVRVDDAEAQLNEQKGGLKENWLRDDLNYSRRRLSLFERAYPGVVEFAAALAAEEAEVCDG